MIKLVDPIEFNKQKAFFLRFVKHFQNNPKNDIEFLLYHKKLLQNEPELTNYTYQLAFDICYKKKTFDAREVEKVFDNKFKIVDMYNMNGDFCDVSTINSAFIVDRLKSSTSPFKEISAKIYNAPMEYHTNYYYDCQKQPKVNAIIQETKKMVGSKQTNPDLDLGNRVVDIKHYGATYVISKNMLQPWTFERIEKDFYFFMNNYCDYFKKVVLSNNNNKYSETFYNKLLAIKKDTTLSIHEKNRDWNTLFAEYWHRLDKNVPTPLILQMTNQPYIPSGNKYLRNNIHISTDVLENPSEVRKVVRDIVQLLGEPYKTNAEIMTEGIITVPFIDSSLEVD